MLKKVLSLSLIGMMLLANPGWAKETRTEEVYTIKRGDTLWDISKKLFNDPLVWRNLWKYDGNKYIRNPHWIYPGNPVIIPPKEKIERKLCLRQEIERLKSELEKFKEEEMAGPKKEGDPGKEAGEIEELRQRMKNIEAALLSHHALLERLNLDETERRITDLEDNFMAIKKRMAINEVAAEDEYQKIESEITTIGENIYRIKEIVIKKEEKKGSTGDMAPYLLIALAFGAIALAAD